jgi:hypothetical protein
VIVRCGDVVRKMVFSYKLLDVEWRCRMWCVVKGRKRNVHDKEWLRYDHHKEAHFALVMDLCIL